MARSIYRSRICVGFGATLILACLLASWLPQVSAIGREKTPTGSDVSKGPILLKQGEAIPTYQHIAEDQSNSVMEGVRLLGEWMMGVGLFSAEKPFIAAQLDPSELMDTLDEGLLLPSENKRSLQDTDEAVALALQQTSAEINKNLCSGRGVFLNKTGLVVRHIFRQAQPAKATYIARIDHNLLFPVSVRCSFTVLLSRTSAMATPATFQVCVVIIMTIHVKGVVFLTSISAKMVCDGIPFSGDSLHDYIGPMDHCKVRSVRTQTLRTLSISDSGAQRLTKPSFSTCLKDLLSLQIRARNDIPQSMSYTTGTNTRSHAKCLVSCSVRAPANPKIAVFFSPAHSFCVRTTVRCCQVTLEAKR